MGRMDWMRIGAVEMPARGGCCGFKYEKGSRQKNVGEKESAVAFSYGGQGWVGFGGWDRMILGQDDWEEMV